MVLDDKLESIGVVSDWKKKNIFGNKFHETNSLHSVSPTSHLNISECALQKNLIELENASLLLRTFVLFSTKSGLEYEQNLS